MTLATAPALTLAICLVADAASAEQPSGKAPAAESSGAQVTPVGGVRRDPNGVKGISPFWESLVKGDKAFVAGKYDAAIAAFADAVKAQPKNPLGHYRLGEAYLAKGKSKEAEEAWRAALRLADKTPDVKAKALFVLADLKERQREWDAATERWKAYETAVKDPNAKGYPETAADRLKRISAWQELEKQSAEVKSRIERRLKEAEAKAQDSAKKSPP